MRRPHQLVGHSLVGTVGGQGEVAGALLRAGRPFGKVAMQLPHADRLGHPDEARGEQRVGEGHLAVADDHHAGPHGRVEGVAGGRVEAVDHGLSHQGRAQERLERGLRQPGQALADERVQLLGHGQRRPGTELAPATGERAGKLESEEGVAAPAT